MVARLVLGFGDDHHKELHHLEVDRDEHHGPEGHVDEVRTEGQWLLVKLVLVGAFVDAISQSHISGAERQRYQRLPDVVVVVFVAQPHAA